MDIMVYMVVMGLSVVTWKEDELLLEFDCAMDLVIANTMFNKGEAKKITYESGGCKTVVDYIMVRESDHAKLKDVKVIRGDACIP
jgi:hypothetical protein